MDTALGTVAGVTAPRTTKATTGIQRLGDVAKGLQKKVTLAKLVGYDEHIRPYLAALIVGSMAQLKEKLVVPDTLELAKVSKAEFENWFNQMSNQVYDQHGLMGHLMGHAPKKEEDEGSLQEALVKKALGITPAIEEVMAQVK